MVLHSSTWDMPKVLVAVSAMISGSNEVSVLISLIHFWTFHNQIRLKQYDILAYLNLSFSPPSRCLLKVSLVFSPSLVRLGCFYRYGSLSVWSLARGPGNRASVMWRVCRLFPSDFICGPRIVCYIINLTMECNIQAVHIFNIIEVSCA